MIKVFPPLPATFFEKAKQNAASHVTYRASCRVFEELVEEGLDILEPDWKNLTRQDRKTVIMALYDQLDPVYKKVDPSYNVHKSHVKKAKVYLISYEVASHNRRQDLEKAALIAETLETGSSWQTRMRIAIASIQEERKHTDQKGLEFSLPNPDLYATTTDGRLQIRSDFNKCLKPFIKRWEAVFGREEWLQNLKTVLRGN